MTKISSTNFAARAQQIKIATKVVIITYALISLSSRIVVAAAITHVDVKMYPASIKLITQKNDAM